MSAENFLQGIVGKIGEFYEWIADRLNDDAARAEVLIDLGLPPTIAVGQPFPQHQIKGINEYRKTISIETEVSAAHAQDLGKVLGLSSSKAAKLVVPEKNLANIRAYRDANDPSFDDFKKALADIKEIFTTLTNFVKALDVEGIHNIPELVHRLLDILMVDYLRLHLGRVGPIIYWLAEPLGFLEEPVTATIPHVVWNRFVTIFTIAAGSSTTKIGAHDVRHGVHSRLGRAGDARADGGHHVHLATGRWRPLDHRHRTAVWVGSCTRLPDAAARHDVRADAVRPLQLERA